MKRQQIIMWIGIVILFICVAMSCKPMTKAQKIEQVRQEMYESNPWAYERNDWWTFTMLENYDVTYALCKDGDQSLRSSNFALMMMYVRYFKKLKIPIKTRLHVEGIRDIYEIEWRRKIFIPYLPISAINRA